MPRISPMLSMTTNFSIGELLGTGGGRQVAENLSREMNGGDVSVLFAANDPLMSGYQTIKKYFVDEAENNLKLVHRSLGVIQANNIGMIPIETEDDLLSIPECMYMPILTYAPVRELLESNKIYGFGLAPENIPDGDMWGRLAQTNGRVDMIPGEKVPEHFEWIFKSDDPDYEIEDLDAIDRTRGFIDSWLKEELKSDTPRDLTDCLSLMST